VSEFSRTIIDFIHDNSGYMEIDIKCILQAKTYYGKSYPTPRTYLARRDSRVLYEFVSFIFSAGGHKSVTPHVQVGPRVE
jgi:hypothetical protein